MRAPCRQSRIQRVEGISDCPIGRPAAFHSGYPSASRRALKPRAQHLNRIKRQDTPRAAAIGDDLGFRSEVCDGGLDFGERDIASTGKVVLVEFIRRPLLGNPSSMKRFT
jgi:hypothetical protein